MKNEKRQSIINNIHQLIAKLDWNNFNYQNRARYLLSFVEDEMKRVKQQEELEYKRDKKNITAAKKAFD